LKFVKHMHVLCCNSQNAIVTSGWKKNDLTLGSADLVKNLSFNSPFSSNR
jgi:hypothetical protein